MKTLKFTKLVLSVAVTLVCVGANYRCASAAFLSNVESFSGNVKDTEEWEECLFRTEQIVWNERLSIESPGVSDADYTTKNVTVGIGEGVQVELVEVSFDSENARATLCLTSNSRGTEARTIFDSHVLLMQYYYHPVHAHYFGGLVGGSGEFYGLPFGGKASPPEPDNPYIMEIMRTSADFAQFTVYNSDFTPLGSVSYALAPVTIS